MNVSKYIILHIRHNFLHILYKRRFFEFLCIFTPGPYLGRPFRNRNIDLLTLTLCCAINYAVIQLPARFDLGYLISFEINR